MAHDDLSPVSRMITLLPAPTRPVPPRARRSHGEIDNCINECFVTAHHGRPSRYPRNTYEDGVRAALEWVMGQSDDHPLGE
jgi:hypothetical protein